MLNFYQSVGVLEMGLQDVLNNSTYCVSRRLYSVAKVNQSFPCQGCFLYTRDEIEITAIYEQSQVHDGIIEEKRDYALIGINVSVPFYAPGFIAAISTALARENISILVVSTYSRDYFLVSKHDLFLAKRILNQLGLCEVGIEV